MKSRLLLSAIALITLISAPQTAQAKETGPKKSRFSTGDLIGYSCLAGASVLALKNADTLGTYLSARFDDGIQKFGEYKESFLNMGNGSKAALGIGLTITGLLFLKRKAVGSFLDHLAKAHEEERKEREAKTIYVKKIY